MINPLNTAVPAPVTSKPGGNQVAVTAAKTQQIDALPAADAGKLNNEPFTAAITTGLRDVHPAADLLQKIASLVQIKIADLLVISPMASALPTTTAAGITALITDLQKQVQTNLPFQGALFDTLQNLLGQNIENTAVKNSLTDVLRIFSSNQQLPRTAQTVSSNLSQLISQLTGTGDTETAHTLWPLLIACQTISKGEGMNQLQLPSAVPAKHSPTSQALVRPVSTEDLLTLSRDTLQQIKTISAKYASASPKQEIIHRLEKSLFRLQLVVSELDLPKTVARLAKVLGDSPETTILLQNALAETKLPLPGKTTMDQVLNLLTTTAEKHAGNENITSLCDQSLRSIASSLDGRIPLIYCMLPSISGQPEAIGELWIDPDAEAKRKYAKPGIHLLLALEIPDVGHLEVEIKVHDQQLSSQLFCPPEHLANFASFNQLVKDAANAAGFSVGTLKVDPLATPRSLDQVFDKKIEGRSGLNVRI